VPHPVGPRGGGRPLGPPVAAVVLLGAVTVVLAVGLVVLAVVTDEVTQREAVVGGDEVHAGIGAPPASGEEVARPRQSGGQLGHLARVAPPEPPDAVAVLAVPLRPPRR